MLHTLSPPIQPGYSPIVSAATVSWLLALSFSLSPMSCSRSATIPLMMFGVVLWGLHMGFTQGLLATLVADTAPVELRGTAFGMFNLVTGTVLLIASIL